MKCVLADSLMGDDNDNFRALQDLGIGTYFLFWNRYFDCVALGKQPRTQNALGVRWDATYNIRSYSRKGLYSTVVATL